MKGWKASKSCCMEGVATMTPGAGFYGVPAESCLHQVSWGIQPPANLSHFLRLALDALTLGHSQPALRTEQCCVQRVLWLRNTGSQTHVWDDSWAVQGIWIEYSQHLLQELFTFHWWGNEAPNIWATSLKWQGEFEATSLNPDLMGAHPHHFCVVCEAALYLCLSSCCWAVKIKGMAMPPAEEKQGRNTTYMCGHQEPWEMGGSLSWRRLLHKKCGLYQVKPGKCLRALTPSPIEVSMEDVSGHNCEVIV